MNNYSNNVHIHEMNRLFLLIWFWLPFMVQLNAQNNYIFRNFTIRNGLPDNTIKSLFLSPDGRLGIRTTALLAFDNGGNYSTYSYNVYASNYAWDYSRVNRNYYSRIYQEYVDGQGRIWMKEPDCLRVFNISDECFIDNVDSLLQKMGMRLQLQDMFIDSEKNFWFVRSDGELWHYDEETSLLQQVMNDKYEMDYGYICDIDSHRDSCWIVYSSGILCCWDKKTKKIVRKDLKFKGRFRSGERIVLKVLSDDTLWLKWQDGVACYYAGKCRWHEVEGFDIKESDLLTSMAVDERGIVWVGSSRSGLYVIDRKDFTITHIPVIPLVDGGSIRNDILSIVTDKRSLGVWLGCSNQGICYYMPGLYKFLTVSRKSGLATQWKSENVRSMISDGKGGALMGTNEGLYSYNSRSGEIFLSYPELADKVCRKMLKDSKGRIWVGTFKNGLFCIENEQVKKVLLTVGGEKDYTTNLIRCLYEDSRGRIWVGVFEGLCLLDCESSNLEYIKQKHPEVGKFVNPQTIVEDEKGRLIVGGDNGYYYYDPQADKVEIPIGTKHTNNKYNCIFRDSRGMIWFGTHRGMNIQEPSGNLQKMKIDDGISSNIVECILEDRNGDIWFSTANGINKVVVSRKDGKYQYQISTFDSDDGLMHDPYNVSSGFCDADGMLYFGGIKGFSTFMPENIIYNRCDNYPIFTSLKIFYSDITPQESYHGRKLLLHSLNYSQKIELEYNENYITLEFAGLNYANPSRTYYRYRMKGVDPQWQESRSSSGLGKVTYSSLRPGRYVFEVYTANNDHFWGSRCARLVIHIHEPFYNTWAAKMVYALIFVFVLAGAVYYTNKRNKRKIKKIKQIEQIRQQEELTQMKFRFFTNISHELRTPLTLIITPLGTLLKTLTDEGMRSKLMSMYDNAQKLMTMVNQLLDFRKLEMNGEKLNLTYGDIVDFIRKSYIGFNSMAEEKGLTISMNLPDHPLCTYFDKDKVYKILNNLLSNACKFTDTGGRIDVAVTEHEENTLMLEVKDTGRGIAADQLPHIFERFYQASTNHTETAGTGIGLHIVKEYTRLMGGKVTAESTLGNGTTFRLTLPVSPISHEEKDSESTENKELMNSGRPSILIVEDNVEFRTFLKEQLDGQYDVLIAGDGKEGEQIAIDKNPTLIVSDVMMPVMDGMELCERVKNNIHTSHIPIILLTARDSDEDEISGYEVGADSYIVKPFNFDVLLVRIKKLIELQEKRKNSFQTSIEITPSTVTVASLDEKLMQKILVCVEKNMDNSEYSVEQLAQDVGMSRMHLYRKTQALTGQTPVRLIRSIRMKRAAQLLRDSGQSVKEVAYMAGFSSIPYFAKCFKEMFGMLPSEYIDGKTSD